MAKTHKWWCYQPDRQEPEDAMEVATDGYRGAFAAAEEYSSEYDAMAADYPSERTVVVSTDPNDWSRAETLVVEMASVPSYYARKPRKPKPKPAAASAPKPVYSQFVPAGHDGRGAALNEAQAAFEIWLKGQGYWPAVDVCPYEIAEGGYQGADFAGSLIPAFLDSHARFEKDRESLEGHASEIGEISNQWNDEPDENEEEPEEEP